MANWNWINTGEEDTIRQRPQSARWYLAVHRPASVLQATLSGVPPAYPAGSIAVNVTGGTSANVKAGMTLYVGNSAGASDKGKVRVRRDMSGGSIEIAEAGCGLINWKANDNLTVVDRFEPWVKHIRFNNATSQWVIDYDEYHASQLLHYGPVVRMGGPFVGILENNETTKTGSFVGNNTEFIGSGGFSTASWNAPVGACVLGTGSSYLGAASAPTEINFSRNADGKYVSLVVTDSNGASHRGRRLAFVGRREDFHRVQFGQVAGGLTQGGYEAEFRVFSNAGSENFPDGAEFVIFEEASYGNTASTFGGNTPFRSNVVMRGWIMGETVTVNPFWGDVSFRGRTIDGMLDSAESYDAFLVPSGIELGGSYTTDWIWAASLTLDRFAYYLVRHRSTVADIVDFNFASGLASKLTPYQLPYQNTPRGPFWGQLKDTYEMGILGKFGADLQSNLWASRDIQIVGDASLTAPLNMTIEREDRRDQLFIEHPHKNRVSDAKLFSVASPTGSATYEPYGAEAPGNVIGYQGGRSEVSKGLFASQDDLVQWVGNYYAKMNNPYPRTTVLLSHNARIDSVPQSRVRINLAASDNARDISWRLGSIDREFIPNETRLTYDPKGFVTVDLDVEGVIDGMGGSAFTFPSVSAVDTGDPPPPPPPPPVPDPGPDPQGDGFGTVYVVDEVAIYRTRAFGNTASAAPSWTDITGTLAGQTIYDFALHPWRPSTDAMVVATNGIYHVTGLDGAGAPTYTLVVDTSATGTIGGKPKIVGSINDDGVWFCAYQNGTDLKVVSMGSDGASYSISTPATGNVRFSGAFDVVPHPVNGSHKLYVAWYNTDSNDSYVKHSEDAGSTWSASTKLANSNPFSASTGAVTTCHCPYNLNEDGDYCWIGVSTRTDYGGASATWIEGGQFYTTNGGATWNEQTVDDNSHLYPCKRTSIESWTDPDNTLAQHQLYMWRQYSSAAIRLYTSSDGGATWTEVSTTGISGAPYASGGFPYASAQFYLLTQSGAFLSVDGGATWVDKTGDLPTLNLNVGYGVIVPDWTE